MGLVIEENVNSSILELIVQIHRRRIHRRFTNRQTGEQRLSVGIIRDRLRKAVTQKTEDLTRGARYCARRTHREAPTNARDRATSS